MPASAAGGFEPEEMRPSMWEPVALGVVAWAVRMLCWAAAWQMMVIRERERGRTLVTLLLTAGPGVTVTDRRSDGSLLVVAPGGPAGHRDGEGARG
jgi:hypothetical protein